MLNATCQSHPIKMDCCSINEKSLIVTTINPIWRSHPVHPGTKKLSFVALKARKTSSLHTMILRKQTQTKHLIILIFNQVFFPSIRTRYLKPIAINTHIDCANNSKCSVRDILRATKQGAFESVFVHFLLD